MEPLGIVVLSSIAAAVGGYVVGESGTLARHLRKQRAASDGLSTAVDDLERRVLELHNNLREEQAVLAREIDRLGSSHRDLAKEITEVKTFVVETAQAAAAQRQQEAEREAFIQEAALMEQRRQMATVRQEILEQLSAEVEVQRLAELTAAKQRLQPPTPPAFRQEAAAFDPERLFGLQQEFVARRRAAQGAEYAGPKGAMPQGAPTAAPDQPQPGL